MIAVDTNILVYAHRPESEWHLAAFQLIRSLTEGSELWAIPWPCVHEFYNVVTNARALKPPSTIAQATLQISSWFASPSLVLLHEGLSHWDTLQALKLQCAR